jgi:hypothetical protein
MRALLSCRSLVALSLAFAAPVLVAQAPGGLYIAGDQFDFEQAAQVALAENAAGQRYFVLVLAPASQALSRQASGKPAALRGQISASGGILLACQRDLVSGAVDAKNLVPGVVPVRGWPPPDFDRWPPNQHVYPGEDPAQLPVPTEQLRRARAACSP